jgi:hypothetical protein
MSDPIMAELLARLDSLAARVAEQETEIRRLKGLTGPAPAIADADSSCLSRRDLLVKGTVGLAVTALAASTPGTAHAETRTTVLAQNAAGDYGAAVAIATRNPDTEIPALTTSGPYCLVASTSSASPDPTFQTAVLGTGNLGRGVTGMSNSNYGVLGVSRNNTAVRAEIPNTSTANAIAMYAQNYSSYAGAGPGAGGFGVYGLSARGHGLVGATAAPGGAAVVGATNGVAGAFAGAFYGPLIVSGDFTVVGGAKSAAVLHRDGSHRRLYCIESPESWFEDFGQGTLECGRAVIRIDEDFAAAADTDDYHVFLTAYDNRVIHVAERTPEGFTVQADGSPGEVKGGSGSNPSGSFSWRVVARRRDIQGARFERVTVPMAPVLPEEREPPSGPRD